MIILDTAGLDRSNWQFSWFEEEFTFEEFEERFFSSTCVPKDQGYFFILKSSRSILIVVLTTCFLVISLDSHPCAILSNFLHASMIVPLSSRVSAITFALSSTWEGKETVRNPQTLLYTPL